MPSAQAVNDPTNDAPAREKYSTCGPIIMWIDYGCEGWQPRSYATVKDALEDDRYGANFLITRIVQYEIKES